MAEMQENQTPGAGVSPAEGSINLLTNDLPNIRAGFARRLAKVVQETYGKRGGALFARDLGMPGQTIRTWLNGHSFPTGEKLVYISWKTGRSVDYLLFGKEGSQLSVAEELWLKLFREIRHDERVLRTIYQMIEIAKAGLTPKKPPGEAT